MQNSFRLSWTPSPALLALLTLGALHALSFAPGPLPHWSLPFVQIFTLAAMAWHAMRATGLRQALGAGYAFSFGNFCVGLYWLYISLHHYGDLAAPLAIGAVMILAAWLALYGALATGLAYSLGARYFSGGSSYQRQLLSAAIWASCWALSEWLRGTLFTGLPWLNIGYAHVEGVLSGWAPIVGVYGVAWLAAFASAAIALLACAKDTQNDARAAVGVGVAVLTGLAGIFFTHMTWAVPHGKPMIVRLVQGNIPQSDKFEPSAFVQGQIDYLELASLEPRSLDGKPNLIVLPETVVPLFQDEVAPNLWDHWLEVARTREADIIMGMPLHDRLATRDRYTNSAIGFDANTPAADFTSATMPMRYDKHHLVPFGEFVPPGFRWFVDALSIPLGDFDRGQVRQPLFAVHDQMIAPNICYEDVFGEEIIQSVRPLNETDPGASILLNLSNLGWFGDSWALRQHLQISRMRALETARPMLRATNTGMTAAIDPDGSVRGVLDAMHKGVLDVEVQGTTGMTPYVRWGNSLALIWLGLFLVVGVVLRLTGRRPSQAG
ncbi:apolipoprotein N-acyltransferase [Allopusillimonas ginsengisoli]|uniref:apolipoprotein N-acyltransferase n=1 Tax=Allopusillimonas ginsengisoli TaxID=453575 RepID=UPI001FD6C48B|nr:apolipoprotein N-acyltransferase [Allopusillimonas ginsengisoli]